MLVQEIKRSLRVREADIYLSLLEIASLLGKKRTKIERKEKQRKLVSNEQNILKKLEKR